MKDLSEELTNRFERSERTANKIDTVVKQHVDQKFADFLQKIHLITKDVDAIKKKMKDGGFGSQQAVKDDKKDTVSKLRDQIHKMEKTLDNEKEEREKDAKKMNKTFTDAQEKQIKSKKDIEAAEVKKAKEEASQAK